MLIVKGTHVSLVMVDPTNTTVSSLSVIAFRSSCGMMHDPYGESWPYTSVLIGPYKKTSKKIKPDGPTMRYLGSDYDPRAGSITVPSRSLKDWTRVCDVESIEYRRTGTIAPVDFEHEFERETWLLKTPTPVVLYELNEYARLEFTDHAVLDEHGFVAP